MQIMERFSHADKNFKDFYIAFFLAFASFLSYIEGFIPKPIPGIKLGLSNSIVLIFIIHKQYKTGIFISLSKVFVVSLFTGTLLSPAFILGISGSFFSTFSMVIIYALLNKRVSLIGVSLTGAFFHISSQLAAAYFLLPGIHSGIQFLAGILLSASFVSGIITALFANYLVREL